MVAQRIPHAAVRVCGSGRSVPPRGESGSATRVFADHIPLVMVQGSAIFRIVCLRKANTLGDTHSATTTNLVVLQQALGGRRPEQRLANAWWNRSSRELSASFVVAALRIDHVATAFLPRQRA